MRNAETRAAAWRKQHEFKRAGTTLHVPAVVRPGGPLLATLQQERPTPELASQNDGLDLFGAVVERDALFGLRVRLWSHCHYERKSPAVATMESHLCSDISVELIATGPRHGDVQVQESDFVRGAATTLTVLGSWKQIIKANGTSNDSREN